MADEKNAVQKECLRLCHELGTATIKKVQLTARLQEVQYDMDNIEAELKRLQPQCRHERNIYFGRCQYCMMPMPKSAEEPERERQPKCPHPVDRRQYAGGQNCTPVTEMCGLCGKRLGG